MTTHEKKCLIWTRSLEDWPNDRLLIEARQISYIHLPCILTQRLEIPAITQDVLSHKRKVAIFTSLRAGAFALENERLTEFLREAEIFCFGEKVRAFLEKKQFPVKSFASLRSATEMVLPLSQQLHSESFVLLPGPRLRAFALDEALRKNGFQTQSVDLYETVPSLTLSEKEKDLLISTLDGTLCLASPSSCLGFVECLKPQNNRLGTSLSVIALGPTTAEIASKYFANIKIAKQNSVESLLEMLLT